MKAQIAIEFMIIFGAFLIAIILIATISWNNMVNINRSTVDFESNRILNLVSGKIDTSYLQGHGFSINVTVPERIQNYNYTIEIEGLLLWIQIDEASFSKRLLTSNITGTLSKGTNRIENVNGGIVIS